MSWRDEPATEKQLRYCQEIYENSEYYPPQFMGTTKGEASDYIDKHARLAHENLWAIEHGY